MLWFESMESGVLYNSSTCARCVLKVKLKSFLQVGQRLLLGLPKAGNVYIKTLGNIIFVFLIYDRLVNHLLHNASIIPFTAS
jgi:hypothetical protein